jgi:hypothetical protein
MRKGKGCEERRTGRGGRALMAKPHGGKGETKKEARGAKMAERKGKKPQFPLPLRFIRRGRALRGGCPAHINCRESFLLAGKRTPPRPQRPRHRKRAIITVKTRRGRGRRSRPPAHAAHYARARPQRLKRRAHDAKTAASTVEHLMARSLVKQGEPSSGTDSWLGIN